MAEYSAILTEYRAPLIQSRVRLTKCMVFLMAYTDLSIDCMALLIEYRALSIDCRALSTEYRAFFGAEQFEACDMTHALT